jgi:hypothetical protein
VHNASDGSGYIISIGVISAVVQRIAIGLKLIVGASLPIGINGWCVVICT